jgi:pyruvate kinase
MIFKSFTDVPKRKTKIVGTLGPSTNSRETIRKLLEAGMNVARLNFSHGTHEQHSELLVMIREEADKLERHIAVFQDLSGPKVRIAELADGTAHLEDGGKIALKYSKTDLGNKDVIFVEAFDPAVVLQPGHKVLLSDGQIELITDSVDKSAAYCTVRAGGTLRSRSGIAVPDSKLGLSCITDKDLKDLRWAVANNLDYVALSFVGTAKDVTDLKDHIKKLGANIPVIAKIERAESLDHISEIVAVSDAVMVARGDLGLELPLERVPTTQKMVIDTANNLGVPVIVATQMLTSMVHNLRPTRAEVSDVCTAFRDGTSAVMLSDETAIGKHPIEVIQVLDRILLEAESQSYSWPQTLTARASDKEIVPDSICYAACNAAEKINASAIVACTQSGYSARLVSKYRPKHVLFGATSEKKTLNRMALYWGVIPMKIDIEEKNSLEDEVTRSLLTLRDDYGVKPGARIVITAGLRTKKTGTTNVLEIRDIPRSFSQNLAEQASKLIKRFEKTS